MKKALRLSSLLVFVFALLALVACAPANSDKAKAKLEKAGYTVSWVANREVGDKGEVGTLTALKDVSLANGVDGLTATLYNSKKNAKAAYNDTKNAEGKTNVTLVGKWVVYGSEAAVKAFK